MRAIRERAETLKPNGTINRSFDDPRLTRVEVSFDSKDVAAPAKDFILINNMSLARPDGIPGHGRQPEN